LIRLVKKANYHIVKSGADSKKQMSFSDSLAQNYTETIKTSFVLEKIFAIQCAIYQ